ncbi:c6 zinc finger domain containing [Trichoderma arundinaceum]|uniref:C6 zinc finger domain containing n=1 Tax=Trichoderma arundinaceum TaxID=490622 RepID=A0A395NJQ8_TRIAR|nr:c6 zinc finger domain containing [Trichoderma arundinaceum]
MTQAVKRACDACHRRKVKCDGINPCRNCSSAQLSCTYNAIPQKKGPKGSRAKVISELRETQRQTSLSAKVQNRMNGIPCTPMSSSLAPTPGMLTSDMVKDCSQFFFDNMNSQAPILDRRQFEQQILYMEQNRDAYCLMASMCAFVMLQPGMTMPAGDPYNLDMVPGANIISSQLLLEETLRVRKGYEYLDQITVNALATNFFLFGCYYGQEMHEKAWYYLREATTMIQMVGMNKEEYYMQFDVAEASRLRRVYWLFFVIERAYAIQRQRPLTLQATINLPTLGDDPTDPLAHQLNGFILLVNLFRPFDDAFTSTWNKTRSHLSSQYISNLQKQLGDLAQSYLCQDSSWNDVHTNQQWLKNTVWQLSNGVVAGATEESMSFQYPMNMSRELLMNMASQFPGQGMELLNSGLLEKLIEGAYSMTEYLAMQPASRDPFAIGPQEHLSQIITIVAASRNGDYRFLPLLMSKVSDVLPRLANPMLQNVPETAALANVDIFDGFGNAGMAQPPQMQMMDTDYDRKFSVEEYEKKYAMEMNGSPSESHTNSNAGSTPPGPRQQSEMAGSFVSSPPMMSPTMEYPHGINGYACTPMSEMVMSPIGNHPPPPPQHQHISQPPPNHCHDPMGPQHLSMAPQNMRPGMQPPHMNNMMNVRQPPQRQDSFAMAGQPQHFHNMNAMTGEINFNSLR